MAAFTGSRPGESLEAELSPVDGELSAEPDREGPKQLAVVEIPLHAQYLRQSPLLLRLVGKRKDRGHGVADGHGAFPGIGDEIKAAFADILDVPFELSPLENETGGSSNRCSSRTSLVFGHHGRDIVRAWASECQRLTALVKPA